MRRIGEKIALLAAIVLFGSVAVLDLWYFVRQPGWPGDGAVLPARANALSITTDRSRYSPGERIRIIFNNFSSRPMLEQPEAPLMVASDHALGANYGVGMIERWQGSDWLAVEPVWRCAGPCREACGEATRLEPGGRREFNWDRTVLDCAGPDEAGTEFPAPPGRYRVTTAVWDETARAYRQSHSPEFFLE